MSVHSVQLNYHHICHLSSPLIIIKESHLFVNLRVKVNQSDLLQWFGKRLSFIQVCSLFSDIIGHLVQRFEELASIYVVHFSFSHENSYYSQF